MRFPATYVVALVRLEEGPLVSAMLTDVLPEEVYIGMPVEMVTRVLHRQGERGVIAYGYKFRACHTTLQKGRRSAQKRRRKAMGENALASSSVMACCLCRHGSRPGRKLMSEDIVQTMVQRIVERFHPVRIILFGSRARGEAGPWSDVDLLVVLPEVTHKRKAMVEILRALSDLPVATDVIVSTPEELERRGHVKGDVLRAALREGKVLYEGN